MRIMFVIDNLDWAIGKLALAVDKYNPQHQVKFLIVPPRELGTDIREKPNQELLDHFLKETTEFRPDLIQFEYWRLAGQMITWIPELRRYKKVIMQHNMRDKSLFGWDWQNNQGLEGFGHLKMNKVLCHCVKTAELMRDKGVAKDIKVIRYGLDHDYWTYSDEEPEDFTIGYAGRIVPWKRLKEVAEVAIELDRTLQVMGKIDKASYYDTIPQDNLRFDFLDCEDKDRIGFYRSISVFVQNSMDGYEEGPLPLLEAMACGVPVITTPVGQAGNYEGIFKDRENCIIIPFEDNEALKDAIIELEKDKEFRDKLRKNAWNTVKNMTEEKMAREYNKVWYDVVYPDYKLASVIVPVTFDRYENVLKIVKAIKNQTYPNIELVVVFDESEPVNGKDKEEYKAKEDEIRAIADNLPVKIYYTNSTSGYNIAKARNIGIIEAEGEYIIFNDSRLKLDENAVMMFVEAIKNASILTSGGNQKVWFFGDKGSQKQSFVENFSAVSRENVINFGMFNERIDKYGGQTQEIRTRWCKGKGEFLYLPEATCEEISSSKVDSQKRMDIIESKMKIWKMYGDDARF